MRKIAVFIGSRANYGRLKSVIQAVTEHPGLELQLILGASFFNAEVPYPVEARIQCLIDGDNLQMMPLTCSMLQAQLGGVLERLNPDCIVIHADRFECLTVAMTAAYMNIPVCHTEGGEVTGTIDEKIRHSITKLADIHFPVTTLSAQRIIRMGENPGRVWTVGSTALDSLKGLDYSNARHDPYMVLLMHPNTTHPEPIEPVFEAIKGFDVDIVCINPNVDPGNKVMLKQIHKQKLEFKKNLPIEQYARLLKNCVCLVGNTSSGIKEGAFLGVPYVCVGKRQEGREMGGNAILVPNDEMSIYHAVYERMVTKFAPSYMFGDGTAGRQIADILADIELKGEKKYCDTWSNTGA